MSILQRLYPAVVVVVVDVKLSKVTVKSYDIAEIVVKSLLFFFPCTINYKNNNTMKTNNNNTNKKNY